MPNIKPVSDLRNYTDVLKEVDASSRVYLTRNGHGAYGILTMAEIDELDRQNLHRNIEVPASEMQAQLE